DEQQFTALGVRSNGGATRFPEIWGGDGEVLLRFQLSALDQRRFGDCELHPLLLDTALEAVRLLLGPDATGRLVPVSLASGSLEKLPPEGWCHVVVRESAGAGVTADVKFLQPDGMVVATLLGLVVRPFQKKDTPAPIFLRPVWQSRTDPTLPEGPLKGRLLLFDGDTALERALQVRYPALSVARVVPAERFAQENGAIRIDPRSWDDYPRVLDAINPDFIVIRWTSLPLELEQALELGVYALFRLTRALMQRNLQSEIRMLFCHPWAGEPAFEAIGAFAKTLMHEQPKLQLRVLQTDDADAGLLAECFAGQDEREIRRHRGIREIRWFEIFEPKMMGGSAAVRQNGVYLLTGGLGGLGRAFADYLANQYRARLVLTGRSALTEDGRAQIARIEGLGGQAIYVRGDVSKTDDVREAVGHARERFGGLHGVIHAAGLLRDAFILKKELSDFADVLSPKVRGALALDEATKDEALDFFALFSSMAGSFGNVGQADYAYANAFLDAFAHAREARRAAGERRGRTVALNWPFWRDGGMQAGGSNFEAHLERIGLFPLPRETGLALFETALNAEEPQVTPLWGLAGRLRETLLSGSDWGRPQEASAVAGGIDRAALSEKAQAYLRETFAHVTQLPVSQIDPAQRFEEYGVDSIVVSDFNLRLEQSFGPLPKTLLFEYPNLRQLAGYLSTAFTPQLAAFFNSVSPPVKQATASPTSAAPSTDFKELKPLARIHGRHSPARTGDEIAIVGLAGRYPKAEDLGAFWEILKSGTDCVTEIPKDRWDIDRYYDPDPTKAGEGKLYARWGAFLDDVDKFDPLFFTIAPVEAEWMDPQERLFLETAWAALEDAGYTRRDLARRTRKEYATNVGVFAGVTTNTYPFVARDNVGHRAAPVSLPWSLANRISYLFNFNGPSVPVDTACSSSLTAIHLACEAIRNGECQQAIAGGVNLYLHPSKYVSLCLGRMLSSEGKCRAFGEGGDGFVPGEGVGAVLLKPLTLALADGDHVYAVIKGTAINHGGRTNGYTVPSPAAQAELIARALKQARIDPRSLTYIEAHGTGTALGDPIEVAGLAKAFAESSAEPRPGASCVLGSVKSNIGHLESAAGIAGLTKVLLQLKHKQLVPSLHAETVNPNITFDGTPFRIQTTLEPWRQPEIEGKRFPRRAGISSFGAGGANAHVLVEEFVANPDLREEPAAVPAPELIVLSARNRERLTTVARDLGRFLAQSAEADAPLSSVAYTLQVGREPLEERAATVVTSRADLIAKLNRLSGGDPEGFLFGRVKRERMQPASESVDAPGDSAVTQALAAGDLDRLARFWVSGTIVNWDDLRQGSRGVPGRRVSLPGYPFSRERCWVPAVATFQGTTEPAEARLHPLLHRNESTLSTQRYASRLDAEEIVLCDHRVGGRKVLPGAASLELALAAAGRAIENGEVGLRQIVWTRPLVAEEDVLSINVQLRREPDGRVGFELQGPAGDVHVQGKAEAGNRFEEETLDLDAIRQRCVQTISPEQLYLGFAARGLEYGPGFRVIQDIRYRDGEVLSRLEVPAVWGDQAYRMHPALVDGALQSLAVLGAEGEGVELPFALGALACGGALPTTGCYAYCRTRKEAGGAVRYDLELLNERGVVLARLGDLSMRRLERTAGEMRCYRPVWKPEPVPNDGPVLSPLLIFDEGSGLAEAAEVRGVPSVRVIPGEAFTRNGNLVTIRPGCAEDYAQLVQEITFAAVVHRWSRAGATLAHALDHGIFSLHRLVQALLKATRKAACLYAYPLGEPAYEAVAAYAKSLRLEQESVRVKAVGLDGGDVDLLAELNDDGLEIRYRADRRETQTLEALPAETTSLERPLRSGGVYLVTGGAGGLGRIFAAHLVQTCQARLLLVGRSGLNEAGRRDLEKLGDAVTYLRADVSTAEGAGEAVREAKRRYGVLNGVIHAAGELRDGFAATKRCEDFEAVLRAKVWGAEALDAATCEEPLDWFILFSSTAGVLGNAGQSDYAYANAYLDSFAQRREALRRTGQRSGRTLSIDWPLWRDGGMRAGDPTMRFQTQTPGSQGLDTRNGLAAFTRALASGDTQRVILFGTPDKLPDRIEGRPLNRRPLQPLRSEPDATKLKAQLLEEIKRAVSKVLRLDLEAIEADADTGEYGFDSISFTALANELNATLGVEITPAVLFEYTTLASLADFLCGEHRAKVEARLQPATIVPPASDPHARRSTGEDARTETAPVGGERVFPEPADRQLSSVQTQQRPPGTTNAFCEPIAIIGMSGVF
ncbi:MAG: SDR family NAD(P)-dependent oxidoreductase, partial [Verrucomicrobia bacterium]|nr:SDR family NAD(P)-dependent oxidoreductase [Verrucomicrobiota bacterium]